MTKNIFINENFRKTFFRGSAKPRQRKLTGVMTTNLMSSLGNASWRAWTRVDNEHTSFELRSAQFKFFFLWFAIVFSLLFLRFLLSILRYSLILNASESGYCKVKTRHINNTDLKVLFNCIPLAKGWQISFGLREKQQLLKNLVSFEMKLLFVVCLFVCLFIFCLISLLHYLRND